MGAIQNRDKNHGIKETDQKAEAGQEAPTDEAAHDKSVYGGRIPLVALRHQWVCNREGTPYAAARSRATPQERHKAIRPTPD
jgi:hypothetical protein